MPTPNFPKEHADQILAHIDVSAIRAKKFKVAVDMINASACVMDPYFFEQLGVELIPLNNIPNGLFAHKPEPLKINLEEIANLVKESKANIGFAQDPDADRLVVINEKGEVISEEYTIALAIKSVLKENKGNVVLNMSTSSISEEVARELGANVYRTKIGEGYVVEGILSHNAIIGGEGNGGVVYPKINICRDSFTGIGLILELLAKENKKISEIIGSFPKYFMKREKIPILGDLDSIYAKLKKQFSDASVNELDKSLINFRASNTEPIIRIFGEAKTEERLETLFEEVKFLIK
jgi:phosphomannomutase